MSDAQLIRSDVARAAAPASARDAAVRAVTAFSGDLFGAVAGGSGNLVVSPYSVATALGMTLQGARGRTAGEMLAVLHADDVAALATGLNGIDAALAARPREVPGPDGKPERLELAGANSLWTQRDVAWERTFLDGLARDFGAGLHVVDYIEAHEPARRAINAWVSERTRTRIPELVAAGMIGPDTRLTLVNALYLKAPWRTRFEKDFTRDAPFYRLDGSTVTTALMSANVPAGYARGDGWQAVDLAYGGDELAMAVVVPDAGRFDAVQRDLGSLLPELLGGFEAQSVHVGLPRWTARTQVELGDTLAGLGMPTAFSADADFSGMTTEQALGIAAVVHEGWIAVDESGTEAAAATAVVVRVTGAVMEPPLSVIADRPFLYVIHDVPTGTPLFIGRVLDPAAA